MNQSPMRVFVKLLFICTVSLASCKKEFNMNKWEPDMLVPLIKGTATIKDVADLRDKIFVQNIPAIDIGFDPFVPVNVPELGISFVGPYPYTLSEYFRFVEVDSAVFEIELYNFFPIPISKGTKVIFRSSADTSTNANIIYSHELSQDIPAYGSYPKITDTVVNRIVTSEIFLYLENFKTAGATNVVFDTQPTQLKFEIKFLSVFRVALNTDKVYGISDTTEMELGEDVADYDDSTATGKLNVFLTSSMPINFNFQMYFYDASQSVLIDSLYYGEIYAPGCNTNQLGVPVDSVERKFEIPITSERVRRLKEAKYMAYRLTGNTYGYPPDVVYAGETCGFKIQITGDIKLKIAALFTP